MNIKLLALTPDLVKFGGWSIGKDADGHYHVIIFQNVCDVDVGDVISADFETSTRFFWSVYCAQKNREFKITVEYFKVSLDRAVEQFLMNTGVPAEIFFMTGRQIITDVLDTDHKVRDEIARS